MIDSVINVAAFTSGKIRKELLTLSEIRDKILDECYSIKGYSELPYAEKLTIYDSIRAKYIDENGNIIDYSMWE
jgi:hypothetical protein